MYSSSDIELNLRHVPHSYRGSLLAIGYGGQSHVAVRDLSSRRFAFGDLTIARIMLRTDNGWTEPEWKADAAAITFQTGGPGSVRSAFQDEDTLRFAGQSQQMRLEFPRRSNELIGKDARSISFRRRYFDNQDRAVEGLSSDIAFAMIRGTHELFETEENYVIDCVPGSEDMFDAAIEWNSPDAGARDYSKAFDEVKIDCATAFESFLAGMPELPPEYERARAVASYVMWSCYVKPGENFKRPAMLMSKNWMRFVWSWDHCFNAIALAYHLPDEAWDQFMVMFDSQAADGRLPDATGRNTFVWGNVKPPIHGWTFEKLMAMGVIDDARLKEGYDVLSKWTRFWMDHFDHNGDGLPEYGHGNDSGWDNCTEFDVITGKDLKAEERRLDSANLYAYLVLQMNTLSGTAGRLGLPDEEKSWKAQADTLMAKMIARCWDGQRFVSKRMNTEASTKDSRSLMAYLPMILGARLPEEIRSTLVNNLKQSGLLTAFGPATEQPGGALYKEDGYWRGPIWAPSTMIIVEGLHVCGEHELAVETAKAFCDLCARSGMAENFDPLTGAPLRDKDYTWTASVFLALGHEYLKGSPGTSL